MKIIVLVGIILLMAGCATPPERTWTENNLGREFERQGII